LKAKPARLRAQLASALHRLVIGAKPCAAIFPALSCAGSTNNT